MISRMGFVALFLLGMLMAGCNLTQIFDRPAARDVYLEQLLQVEDANPHAQFLAAKRLIEQGKGELAEQHLKQALKVDSQRPEFYIALGAAYEEQGKRGKAKDAYERALGLSPDSTQTQIRLGRLALQGEDVEQARRWLERASKKDDSAELWRLRGEIEYVSLKYGEALRSWQESLKRDPSQPVLEELVADLNEYLQQKSE